ncbi:aldo/keto reductase [Clostridium thermobutyricum]|uniref:aldo/keto reductase n=1 Tax=Clostridium thermobutyricum TaxID=29372 RepID=UPI00294233D4|nr:aldo/keto reductase [Clostridium thermobutyricum]
MERIKLTDDLSFSRIIQGFWRLSNWGQTPSETLKFMNNCIELGITTFDTADIYMSETYQREAMKLDKTIRNKIEIVTKCGIKPPIEGLFKDVKTPHYNSTKDHIINSVDNSLIRLGVDNIDVVLIHRPDYLMDPSEVAEAFNEIKKSGKVREFGVSNFTPSQFNLLASYYDGKLVTNQIEISPLTVNAFEDGSIDNAMINHSSLMAWSPLAGGKLFKDDCEQAMRVRASLNELKEKYSVSSIDQIAYAWLLKHPAKIMPIVGTSKISRVKQATSALNINLSHEDWYYILESSLGRSVK